MPALETFLDDRWKVLLQPGIEILEKLDKSIDFDASVPRKDFIFKAFECDPKDVSVVIFGQDPYPDPKNAMGLAFSVDASVTKLPASLKNIYSEMKSDIGSCPADGDLSFLSQQGVMLLNRGLTLDLNSKQVNPLWYQFTDLVARVISDLGAIGVFWGNQAQELAKYFPVDKRVVSVHPSPLSAYRGFFGSQPFSKVNVLLQSQGRKSIDWTKQ